ncbi:phage Gp37/Gp68 family protein [Burkholderia contaminans]|uniref:phage Gp37/Gp68 family protein n=1 Tax=Burkholderia contaminans TaxID=488447 RepID=UPI001CF2F738|nr:phage Gp37/Gp68 family protein [Burkholderia contaminans]MCA7889097.1 phage Gp37/Gp68 family protein [Burkholderia contaminans]
MSENTKIESCDHTFNPWIGCTKISPGCDHCYAERERASTALRVVWGAGNPRHRTAGSTWNKPKRWNAQHAEFFAKHGRRQRVFCASLSDVFDNAVDSAWRADLFRLIADTPNLDWLLLTKRIGNVAAMLREIGLDRLPDNVWLGSTIVNQAEADRDIPKLLEVPARVRFLSMEPLLGPVTFRWASWVDHGAVCKRDGSAHHLEGLRGIDWVIVGGESGLHGRPMHPDWARSLREQCAEAGVPFLFKQWGEWKPICQMDETGDLYRSNRVAKEGENQGVLDELYGRTCKVEQLCLRIDGEHAPIGSPNAFLAGTSPMQAFKIGKKAAGRLLDGRMHDKFPVEVVA